MHFPPTFTLLLWLFCNISYNTYAKSTKSISQPLSPTRSSTTGSLSSTSSSPSITISDSNNPSCTQPLTAANTVVAPILAGNPAYRLPDSFINSHILFFFTDFNIQLPRGAWATFCLDQCIAYSGNKTCRSFEVDQGVPYPPLPAGQNQDKRWWCEGFDVPLSAELYVPNPISNSFERFTGVNRLCENSIRDF